MLAVRRGYLLALVFAALLAVGVVVVPSVVSSAQAAHTRAEVDAALAGLRRLRVPANFVPLTTNCGGYRCFRVAQPTPQAARQLTGAMLRSMGATPVPSQTGCHSRSSRYGPLTFCGALGIVDSEPVLVFLSPHEPFVHGRDVLPPRGSEVDVDFACGIGPRSADVVMEVTPSNKGSTCQY